MPRTRLAQGARAASLNLELRDSVKARASRHHEYELYRGEFRRMSRGQRAVIREILDAVDKEEPN